MGETIKAVLWRALGIIGGAVVTLVLAGFALGYCARAVRGQDVLGAQVWKCSVDVATKDEHGKVFYRAHGWLEVQLKDGAVEKLHRQVVSVRGKRREALHDCAEYLADRVEEKQIPARTRDDK